MSATGSARFEFWAARIFWAGLALYLLVLPVRHTIALRNIALAFILVATLTHLWQRREWPRLFLPTAWAAYATVALASLTYAVSPIDSLHEIRVEIFYGLAVFVIASTWSRRPGVLAGAGYLVAITNALFVVSAISQIGLDTSEVVSLNLTLFAKAGVNSNYIVTVLPLIAHRAWCDWRDGRRFPAALLLALIVLDIYAMLLSYNRQSFAALAAGILCAGAVLLAMHFTWRRFVLLLSFLLVASLLAGWSFVRRAGPSTSPDKWTEIAATQDVRPALWQFSLDRIAERPWSGGGFGRDVFDKLYPDFMPENPLLWHAHNMILNKGIQMGIPGMLTFLFLWYSIVRWFSAGLRRSLADEGLAVAGLTVVGMVFVKNMTDDFFVRDMGQLFWLVIGLFMGTMHSRPAAKASCS